MRKGEASPFTRGKLSCTGLSFTIVCTRSFIWATKLSSSLAFSGTAIQKIKYHGSASRWKEGKEGYHGLINIDQKKKTQLNRVWCRERTKSKPNTVNKHDLIATILSKVVKIFIPLLMQNDKRKARFPMGLQALLTQSDTRRRVQSSCERCQGGALAV